MASSGAIVSQRGSQRRRGASDPNVSWSDAAAVLSAIGTVGAFAVALYLLRVQILDRRADAEDRRETQARLVSGWFDDVSRFSDVAAGPADPPDYFEVHVLIRNGSAEPVYGVIVRTHVGNLGDYVRYPGTLGPEETRELRVVVPPDDMHIGMPRVSIMFRDSAGRQWLRSEHGTLTHPTQPAIDAFTKDSPGAYTWETHPMRGLKTTPEDHRGRRLS